MNHFSIELTDDELIQVHQGKVPERIKQFIPDAETVSITHLLSDNRKVIINYLPNEPEKS